MTSGAPWSVKGIDPKAREIAKDLARRSGMTLGEWLNQVIQPAPEAEPEPTPRRRQFDNQAAVVPTAPVQRSEASAAREDGLRGVMEAIGRLSARIEAAERTQHQTAARLEGAVGDVRADQDTLTQRLGQLEQERSGARSSEALKSLEQALTRVAGHLYEGEGRTRETLDALRQEMDRLAGKMRRVETSNDPDGAAALVEQVVVRISERLERGEAQTSAALKGLEGSFTGLDQRLRKAEAQIEGGGSEDRRFETLAADLAQKVAQVESRSADAIGRVSGEMSRIADAMESRLKRADSAQADALEKLGGEIARITERLAERISNAERRSAQSMDDVGEQVARATERLQQRQERASSELLDRLKQSEERTARLLEEAREKIDQRMAEAQKRLSETAPPTAPAYGDPFASPFGEPFGMQDFPGAAPTTRDFGPPFPEPAFEAPQTGFEAPQPSFIVPRADDEPSSAPQGPPSALDQPAPEPEVAADPFDESPAGGARFDASAFEAADEFEPIERPLAEAESSAVAAPSEPNEAALSRSGAGSTRELIAQARAAARAASEAQEKKGKRGGGKHASGPLFSGFGLGRKRAGGSSLKTALMMSAAAAFLGVGASGYVVMNGGSIAGWSTAAGGGADPDKSKEVATPPVAAGPSSDSINPSLALAIAPDPAAAPSPPSPEAQILYSEAVAAIDAGDASGMEPLKRAANLGYAPAQFFLAKVYKDGKDITKPNLPEARRWAARAAANGEPRAMHLLGAFYANGEGGETNAVAGYDWFKKAAELGFVDSQYNLGTMNEFGMGVAANPSEAYKWYLIAARAGDEEASTRAQKLRGALSPAERAIAEKAAIAFRAADLNPSAVAPSASAAPDKLQVATAQRALSRLGYYQGPSDGTSSPALRLAIAAFQRDRGLPANGALTADLLQQFAAVER